MLELVEKLYVALILTKKQNESFTFNKIQMSGPVFYDVTDYMYVGEVGGEGVTKRCEAITLQFFKKRVPN